MLNVYFTVHVAVVLGSSGAAYSTVVATTVAPPRVLGGISYYYPFHLFSGRLRLFFHIPNTSPQLHYIDSSKRKSDNYWQDLKL